MTREKSVERVKWTLKVFHDAEGQARHTTPPIPNLGLRSNPKGGEARGSDRETHYVTPSTSSQTLRTGPKPLALDDEVDIKDGEDDGWRNAECDHDEGT